MRNLVRLVGVAALLAILTLSLLGQRRPLEAGTPAPVVEGARRLDGKVGTLNLAQGRPVVVNIWATWCPPCLQEMPELAATARKYEGRVRFYGLAVDSKRADVVALTARFALPYEVAEIDGATAKAWNASALPSTYVLDGRGRIVWSIRGPVDMATLDAQLAPLLSDPTAAPDGTADAAR